MERLKTNFEIAFDLAGEDLRYYLNERAAIHEFDGKLCREEAERRAWMEVIINPTIKKP